MGQFIRNLSLRRKIQAIVYLCIFLLSAAALISIRLIASSYDTMLYRTTASSLSTSSAQMHNCLTNLNTMANLILADSTIQRNLGIMKEPDYPQQINVAYKTVYTALTEYYFTFRKDHINYMSIYQDSFSLHTHMPSSRVHLPKEVEEDLLQRAYDAQGATIWITDYSQERGLFLAKSIRRTENLQLDCIGILLVNVDLEGLVAEATSPGFLQQESSYLLYDDENLIYSSPSIPQETADHYAELFGSSYGPISFSGKDFFYVKSRMQNTGWKYVCIIPYDNIMASIYTSIKLCLGILLASVVLATVLSSALIDSITRHFENLLVKIRNFGDGNQEPLPMDYNYENRSDELGILHRQFDHMVKEVNQLIRTNYLNEILIKEAQFKALENQMNPHFLYNTLESINWRAKVIGAKDISAMAESLGTLLRISLDQKSKQVPLRRELELVQSYMTIQKYRYEDRLNYQVSIPENLMECYVLKLTLQPLVENAIRYGLEENTDSCLIQITAEADAERNALLLYIKNNGSSFEEDLLEKLKNHQVEPHGFGIGLLNIQNRMQLTFGESYGLEVYNEDDLAVARLTYPLTEYSKGESNAETNHC